jgi:hypothetical protein
MAVVVNDDPVPSLFRADDRQLLSVSTTEATTTTKPWRWWSTTTPFPLSSEQMVEQSKHEVGLLFLSTIHIEIHIHLKWEDYGYKIIIHQRNGERTNNRTEYV